jgi:hypothetical protein
MAIELTDTEKAALAKGEEIEAAEREQEQQTYTKAREDSESELKFAGKFRTAEDLEKAYVELQKKLGSKSSDEAAEEPDTKDEEAESTEPSEKSAESTSSENTEEKPKAEEPEVPTLSDKDTQSILEAVGGKDTYDKAIEWAAENISKEDQADFNKVLESQNAAAIKFAAEALVQRYKSQADFQGKTYTGRGDANPGVKPYRSREEVNTALSDPRYDRDPAYRNDVADRLAVSPDDLL